MRTKLAVSVAVGLLSVWSAAAQEPARRALAEDLLNLMNVTTHIGTMFRRHVRRIEPVSAWDWTGPRLN